MAKHHEKGEISHKGHNGSLGHPKGAGKKMGRAAKGGSLVATPIGHDLHSLKSGKMGK